MAKRRGTGGRARVVGRSGRRAKAEGLERRVLFAYGYLDNTFGSGGVAYVSAAGTLNRATAVVAQPDGKVVAAGMTAQSGGTGSDFALVRLTTAGAPDATFGNGGKVTTDFAGRSDAAAAVVLQPDGKIVVGGTSSPANNPYTSSFALVRYNADGSLDATFGTGGKVLLNLDAGYTDAVDALALQPDGRIVAVGQGLAPGYGGGEAVLRLNADGSLDTTFATGGYATVGIGAGASQGSAVALLADGSILVAGQAVAAATGDATLALARYTSAGHLDPTFATGGWVVDDVGPTAAPSLAVDAAGGIYVAAGVRVNTTESTGIAAELFKFAADGSTQSTFGTGGAVTVDVPGGDGPRVGLAVQDDGKVLVANPTSLSATLQSWRVSRVLPGGPLDATFGNGGASPPYYVGFAAQVGAAALGPDGNLVVAGSVTGYFDASTGQMVLARFLDGPATRIDGHLYRDLDNSGTYTAGEPPLAGWKLDVYTAQAVPGTAGPGGQTWVGTITTDGAGAYATGPLFVTSATLVPELPSGWAQTGPAVGYAALPPPVAGANVLVNGPGTPVGTVVGTVYQDGDANGTRDAYDTGLSGRTVYADLNGNGAPDAGEPTAVTDGAGSYTLSVAVGGAVQVRDVSPAGWVDVGAGVGTAAVTIGGTTAGPAFGQFQRMALAGVVYDDANGNGERDVTEAGLSGVRVYLDANASGAYDAGDPTAITDASGLFALANLGPATPAAPIGVVTPAGYYDEDAGAVVYNASGRAQRQDLRLTRLNAVRGSVNVRASSGMAFSAGAGLTAYADLNGDATYDAGDVGALTDGNGYFSLAGLPTGTVTVRLVVPSGYALASGSAASFTATVAPATHGYFGTFTLTYTAGPLAPGGVNGQAFQDDNGNGAWDAGELPLAGRTIYLDANNNGALDAGEPTAVTTAAGDWHFTVTAVGTYSFRQVLPAGWAQTQPAAGTAVRLGFTANDPGHIDQYGGVTFGARATTGGVSGTVFADANDSGARDAGEPGISGAAVYLVPGAFADTGVALPSNAVAALTNGSGQYAFTGIAPGSYTVVQPAQYAPSGYDVLTPASRTYAVTVTGGAFATGDDFADVPYSTLSGTVSATAAGPTPAGPLAGVTVYVDANHNGLYDAGERVSVSASDGSYLFAAMPAGTYAVREVLPNGYVASAPASGGLTVAVPGSHAGLNFTDSPVPAASITGYVVVGYGNSNPPSSSDPRLAGVTVYLDGNGDAVVDNGEPTAVTNASGQFTFTGLAAGTYRVRHVLPAGYAAYSPPTGYQDLTLGWGTAATTYPFADLLGTATATGTVIGTAGSNGNSGNAAANAFDGSLTTYFDAPAASGAWAGLDLGTAQAITGVRFAPRAGYASRMAGGQFQGSSTADFSAGVTTLYTVPSTPAEGTLTTAAFTAPSAAFRYVRYLSPANGWCDVAELQFLDAGPAPVTVAAGQTFHFPAGTGTGVAVRAVAGLSVQPGGKAVVDAAGSASNRQLLAVTGTGLSLAGSAGVWTGLLDVGNNDLELAGASLSTVTAQLRQGYANGAWSGTGGIASATAAADARHLRGVGAIGNQVNGATLYPTFDGRAAAASDVLARYTYYGDANLDGSVNAGDYTRVDAGFIGHLSGWFNGDFNYDGVVDGSDYALMDNAFNQQTTSAAPAVALASTGAAHAVATPVAGAPGSAAGPDDPWHRRKGGRLADAIPASAGLTTGGAASVTPSA